jgi:flavin-dependent thymidylate synthase
MRRDTHTGEPGAVRILVHTPDIGRLVAAATRLVTTQASGDSLWEMSADSDRNERLARQLVNMGHLSVIEHATATISFEDVSILVEQYLIQFRLASFTVKSRRYVDFAESGFIVPGSVQRSGFDAEYRRHVATLFQCYSRLQELGIPREDARFVLPYCLRSNFLCTMNLRELCHLIARSLTGPWSRYEEIRSVGMRLKQQLLEIAPFLEGTHVFEEPRATVGLVYDSSAMSYDLAEAPRDCRARVKLVSHTPTPDDIVASTVAAQLRVEGGLSQGGASPSVDELIRHAVGGRFVRNLEHALFTYSIEGLSLAGLTHLTRHRMQSLCVPDLAATDLTSRYVLPDSVSSVPAAETLYRSAAESTREIQRQMLAAGTDVRDRVYLSLCGNVADVVLSMNARELLHFVALRTCNRAQWEIRRVAHDMLSLASEVAPRILRGAGPSCVRFGRCPEGRMSCGRVSEMVERYGR